MTTEEFDLTPFIRPVIKVPFLEKGEIEIMEILIKSKVGMNRHQIRKAGYGGCYGELVRQTILLIEAGWVDKPSGRKFVTTDFGQKEFENWRGQDDN